MIIECTEKGEITHIIQDPISPTLEDVMTAAGVKFLSFPPIPWPEQEVAIAAGEEGEEAQTIMMSMGADFTTADIVTDFILNGQVTKRPVLQLPEIVTLEVGQDVVVHNLPEPCTVYVDGQSYVITDKELTITGEMEAEYEIHFHAFPYMPAFIKVTVHEA